MLILTRHQEVVFLCRTAGLFRTHLRQARDQGQELDYTLKDLRDLARTAQTCGYCGAELRPETVTTDHRQPTARNGPHSFDNLEVCCLRCHRAKGGLTALEFGQLLGMTATWGTQARADLLGRLGAGAARVKKPC